MTTPFPMMFKAGDVYIACDLPGGMALRSLRLEENDARPTVFHGFNLRALVDAVGQPTELLHRDSR